MLKRGIQVFVKHMFLNYFLDAILETRRKMRKWEVCQMDSSKEVSSEEVGTHSYKPKRDPFFFLFL